MSRSYGTDREVIRRVNSNHEDDEQMSLLNHPADGMLEQEDPEGIKADGGHYSELSDRTRHYLGAVYMAAMGVSGLVLAAIGQVLSKLAQNLGMVAIDIGSVFLVRGLGAIIGAMLSAKLYVWFKVNIVIGVGLVLVAWIFLLIPYNKSYFMLHMYFMLLGVVTAVMDTGCQIMTRKIHGKAAGPWLGANTVAFGMAGALVPLVDMLTHSTTMGLTVHAFVIAGVCVFVYTAPDPEPSGSAVVRLPQKPRDSRQGQHYRVEVLVSVMVFLFMGSKVAMTSYLYSFIDQSRMVDKEMKSSMLLLYWVCITVGRLLGVYDQRFVTNTTLPVHLFAHALGATISMAMIIFFPHRSLALWMGIAFFGLFNGPCVGYCYDLNHRLTQATDMSMVIVMLGLNFGASVVPYCITQLWHWTKTPWSLMWSCLATNALPLLLVFMAPKLSDNSYVREGHPFASAANREDVN